MDTAPHGSKAAWETREQILRAALKHFANAGYAATSVQRIVGDARVSKPALYYHFRDKSGLFDALVNQAHDGRFQVVREAAARGRGIREKLVEILTALFGYFHHNRELTRIAFSTAYAAPGEVPPGLCHFDKCRRNMEFFHSLMQDAQAAGELDNRFESRDLAYGFYGLTNFYLTAHLLIPHYRLDR
ncbi:MAG: TetR/AcrR family transcriptional regulator, partial [Verrucomicrobia bacterium]|nr:TetR/AcrR family transcriptional regulator [Verrucomicrobiota bacterium]